MSVESTASRWCAVHDEPAAECWSPECLAEVAETTAGEREVEALLYAHREDALTCYDHPEAYCCVCGAHEVGGHRSHLAATLAALLDRVRREEGAKVLREAADTFAWAGGDEDYRAFRDWLHDRAASVGRGEGL